MSQQEKAEAFPQLSKIFDLEGHANPDLQVLEINTSSNAGTAQAVLKTLVGSNGIKQYREYIASDISQEQLTLVQESTLEFCDVSYSVLNIGNNLLEQGF